MKRPPKSVFYIATATSLVVLSDTLLYTILPSYYSCIGLVPYQVGFLLSINRWVRLATNHLSVQCCRRYPSELWLLCSFFCGALVAGIYGVARIFVILLVARILWGFCFSFIRQAGIMTAVRTGDHAHIAERMGYYRGINSMWHALGIALGGFSHDVFGFSLTMIALSILSLSVIPLANLSQKGLGGATEAFSEVRIRGGNLGITLCGFSVGMVGTGLIMSTLGLIVKEKIGESFPIFGYTVGVATLTGIILSMRWGLEAIGSLLLGAAADRIGRECSILFLFVLGGVALINGVLPIGPVWLILDVIVSFICGTTLYMLLSTQAGRFGPGSVASYVTAVDFGSSLGPFLGWGIVQFGFGSHHIFALGGTFYLLSAIVCYRNLSKNMIS